jgi:hypothetical protein
MEKVLPPATNLQAASAFAQIVSVYCSPILHMPEKAKWFPVVSILNNAHSSSIPEGLSIIVDSKVFKLSPLDQAKKPPKRLLHLVLYAHSSDL